MRAERNFTRFAVPVESPLKPHVISTDAKGRPLADAVLVIPHEDDLDAGVGDNWIVRWHDHERGLLRESTDYYSTADRAADAWWDGSARFEAWVSPLFASVTTAEAA